MKLLAENNAQLLSGACTDFKPVKSLNVSQLTQHSLTASIVYTKIYIFITGLIHLFASLSLG